MGRSGQAAQRAFQIVCTFLAESSLSRSDSLPPFVGRRLTFFEADSEKTVLLAFGFFPAFLSFPERRAIAAKVSRYGKLLEELPEAPEPPAQHRADHLKI